MKTVCIVQARTTSERFPCKVLAGIGGRPMLAHVLERASAIKGVDQVVLAVPENDVKILHYLWGDTFGGSEKDVLNRYAKAAECYAADIIVRVTGDCPLLAPDLIGKNLSEFRGAYTGICQPFSDIADGWDAEIFERRALVNADRYAEKHQREHVTTWIRQASGGVTVNGMKEWRALKCSVDTRQDLERVKLIYENLEDKTDFSHMATWQAWEEAGRP